MVKLYEHGVYLVNGTEIVEEDGKEKEVLAGKCPKVPEKEEAAAGSDRGEPGPDQGSGESGEDADVE